MIIIDPGFVPLGGIVNVVGTVSDPVYDWSIVTSPVAVHVALPRLAPLGGSVIVANTVIELLLAWAIIMEDAIDIPLALSLDVTDTRSYRDSAIAVGRVDCRFCKPPFITCALCPPQHWLLFPGHRILHVSLVVIPRLASRFPPQ